MTTGTQVKSFLDYFRFPIITLNKWYKFDLKHPYLYEEVEQILESK